MDFEDRLRNQLQGQSNNIHVELDSPVAVAHRSTARTRRRLVGLPVAALMLGGIIGGGIWASQDQTADSESVALVGDETTENETADTDDAIADEAVIDDAATGGPATLEQLITQGFSAGPELDLQDISSDKSPGGWGPTQVHSSGGVYYVLSTAPGQVPPDSPESYAAFRPATLYTYDGDAWSINGFGDRLVADFDVATDGVLYAVSTGTTGNVTEFALGQSTDGGTSWAWSPLPTDGHDAAALSPRFATKGDTTLIVSQLPFRQNFGEGVELAASAGLALNEFEITSVDTTGIGYFEQPVSADPCSAAEQAFWQEDQALSEEFFADLDEERANSEEFQNELEAFQLEQQGRFYAALRAAGCEQEAACREIRNTFYNDTENQFPIPPPPFGAAVDFVGDAGPFGGSNDEMAAFYDEQQNKLDQLLLDGGCELEVTCRNLNNDFYESGATEPPFDPPMPPGPTSGEMSEEDMAAFDKAWQDFYEKSEAWRLENQDAIQEALDRHDAELVAAGCMSMMPPDMPDMNFVEWASLGVTAPAEWTTMLIQTVGPNGVQTSNVDVGSYIYEVKVDGDEFVLISAQPGPASFTEDGPQNNEWRSVDGVNWTKTDGFVDNFYNTAVVNGQRFSITWEQGTNASVLERSVVGSQETQRIALTDLAPGLPENLSPMQISAGPIGMIIVVAEQTYTRPPETFYALFSPDGIRWSSQQLASTAQAPSVGDESVLMFEYQNGPRSETPAAVYLGRIDG